MFNRFKRLNRCTKIVILIIILGFFLRLFLALNYTPSGDGCWHASVSRFIGTNLEIPDYEHLGRGGFARAPLFHIMAGGLYKVFLMLNIPSPDLALRLVNPILGLLTLIFVFKLVKRIANEKIALYTTSFMAFIPINVFLNYIIYLDGPVAFFAVASIYYLIRRKFFMASLFVGLAGLANISFVALFPVCAYVLWREYKENIKNLSLSFLRFFSVVFIVSLPWYVRNWLTFGNPVWPWFRFFIGGADVINLPINQFSPSFDIVSTIVYSYLALFGVPDGNYRTFFFFDIPFIKYLIVIWLIGTLVFLVPLVFFRNKNEILHKKNFKIIIVWLISYLLYMILTSSVLSGVTYLRYALPALTAFAIFWSIGLFILNKKVNRLKKGRMLWIGIISVLVVIIVGFSFSEIIKTKLAKKEWDRYKEDFEWIKENTPKESLMLANGQCFSYYFDRQTASQHKGSGYYVLDNYPVDYIWVNQKFTLGNDRYMEEEVIKMSQDYEELYYNPETGTKIYKVK